MRLRRYTPAITDLALLISVEVFLAVYFDARYLFYDTVVTGGDTASWHGVAHHMMEVLLPNGRLTGWDMGNFCGYPNFTFYFIPPFLLAALPAFFLHIPLTITLKLSIMTGIFLLSPMTYMGLRAMKYPFPVPVMGAGASLLFLFNESYNMFGGNTLSTFAGEFCYMFSFSLFAYFIGSLYSGLKENMGSWKNGLLLGLIGLSHLFVFIPALFLIIYGYLEKGKIRYLLKVCLVAFGIMAFWILPLVAYRHPYTTPVYMIWQDFASWRHFFTGLGIILLFIGPRLTLYALGPRAVSAPMLCFWSLGSFTFFFLLLNYLCLGDGIWATGLNVLQFSGSPLGSWAGQFLYPLIWPASLVIAAVTTGAGFWSVRKVPRYATFCYMTGALCLLTGTVFASRHLYRVICGSIQDFDLRTFFLNRTSMTVVTALVIAGISRWLFFAKGFRSRVYRIAEEDDTQRFRMFLGLIFGCAVAYFSAHFLKIPDIRFLPPIFFTLLLIFFGETLAPLFRFSGLGTKVFSALMACYIPVLYVLFGASNSYLWYQHNNQGYEYRPGYQELGRITHYLREAYEGLYPNSLSAPRVGYEKCDMYLPYGGDRVFESLPFFSGRQTMEGIHYASSMGAKCIAFVQTVYSRDIKTPRPYILSRINPEGLPAYLELYNISQLIVMTDRVKKAVESSPFFSKEADFGPLSIYRNGGCTGRYVDVPGIRPVLFEGEDWPEAFYEWLKVPDHLDHFLVPRDCVLDERDRAAFSHSTTSVKDLYSLPRQVVDRSGLRIETEIGHLGIRFSTNGIGLPHVIKVSYFPNWKVKGANGIYPVSPHFMLVIPREPEVVLTYGWSLWEKLGACVTALTLVVYIIGASGLFPRGTLRRIWSGIGEKGEAYVLGPLEYLLNFSRPYVLILTILISWALMAGGTLLRNRPVRAYIQGYRIFTQGMELSGQGKEDDASISFKKAIDAMASVVQERDRYDHQDVLHCILFTAMSHERLGRKGMAEAMYRMILMEYPYSRYVGEANVKIARIRKWDRDQALDRGILLLRRGDSADGLMSVKKALSQTEDSLRYYHAAMEGDPYSDWAGYARDELGRERDYLTGKKDLIYGLCKEEDIRRSLSELLGEDGKNGI